MNDAQKKTLIAWLNDAHAMELSLVKNLEQKSKDAEEAGADDVKARFDEHTEETRNHAVQVESCITRLGGKVSAGKDAIGKMSGYIQGSMKSMYDDVMVKNALESYAAEHFEIAAYTSLIAAARDLGDDDTADICEAILEEEQSMADYAADLIPLATVEHVAAQGAGSK